ncbi:MAG: acyl-CoA thioesterase [Bacteroidales bacterium]|jgi:acyl-CoA thioester hydrolase|nr:acyl-CoA thioesterase [Bacteroidales bacterium]
MQELKASKEITVRFSEVDSMNIVWHGSYSLYFEDARTAFGEQYGLGYLDIFSQGYYVPLVDLSFNYKQPLLFGNKARVDIVFKNTETAKLIFHYEIHLVDDERLIATGKSTQVFLDRDYRLVWTHPPFYEEWKKKHHLI